jgi:hypothetical protein
MVARKRLKITLYVQYLLAEIFITEIPITLPFSFPKLYFVFALPQPTGRPGTAWEPSWK